MEITESTEGSETGLELDKIDLERIGHVAKAAFLMLYEMANDPDRVAFNSLYQPGIQGRSKGRKLGINVGKKVLPTELEGLGLADNQGAVRVALVHESTPAQSAGLKKGDLILSIGSVRIRLKETVTSLKEGIDSAPGDSDVPVEIVRKGKVNVSAHVASILERLGTSTDIWTGTLKQPFSKDRLLGVAFAFSRQRLNEAAARRGCHHLANLDGCSA